LATPPRRARRWPAPKLAPPTSCIEASWALVDVDTAQVVSLQSRLFPAASNAAEAVNGIAPALLRYAEGPAVVALDGIEAVLAHSAAFDSSWGVIKTTAPWVCTLEDWEWPRATTGKKLVEIALAHGVGVVTAHRAFADVLTLCLTLERAHAMRPLREQLDQALTPRKSYAAQVSYDDRELARAAGFRWVPAMKTWVRRMTAEAAAALPFKVRELAG
jgi:DNA polymerase-3 subunit epsilon